MAPNFKKIFEKSPNFAKYLIFGPKTDKKTHFGAIWNFSHLCINPLWTIGHICHTIFGPIRMCGYLNIAPERLKIWKKSAATFCSSWNCASNELECMRCFCSWILFAHSKSAANSQFTIHTAANIICICIHAVVLCLAIGSAFQ